MRDQQQCGFDPECSGGHHGAERQPGHYLCGLLGTIRAAGRQRSDGWNGCDEVFVGFQLVAVAIDQSGYSRSEDGKSGGVRGRSAGRGATILRLHCRHRNGRSRVGNWRKLQRRRAGRDAAIYYRECASFWIHDWQCIERIAGGFDCRAIYADEPDRTNRNPEKWLFPRENIRHSRGFRFELQISPWIFRDPSSSAG